MVRVSETSNAKKLSGWTRNQIALVSLVLGGWVLSIGLVYCYRLRDDWQRRSLAVQDLQRYEAKFYHWHETFSERPDDSIREIYRWVAKKLGPTTVSDVIAVDWRQGNPSDEQISQVVRRLPEIKSISIESDLVTNNTIDEIVKLKQIERVDLLCPNLTMEGALRLVQLPKLRYVTLSREIFQSWEREVLQTNLAPARVEFQSEEDRLSEESQFQILI